MKYDRPKYTSQVTSCRASQPRHVLKLENIRVSQIQFEL
jgi:hypothetical protein